MEPTNREVVLEAERDALRAGLRAAIVEIHDLKRDYATCADSLQSARDSIDELETFGVIELMQRNVNVDSFVREKEREIAQLHATLAAVRQSQHETLAINAGAQPWPYIDGCRDRAQMTLAILDAMGVNRG